MIPQLVQLLAYYRIEVFAPADPKPQKAAKKAAKPSAPVKRRTKGT